MISERLRTVTSMIGRAVCVADIGCDHGFVPITAVSEGISDRAIAMDVRSGPLSKAQENIDAAGLHEKIECRLSDGAEKLEPGEADVITICGMGGSLIQSIMEARPDVFKQAGRLVLGPQSELGDFRSFLATSGYVINSEKILLEGHYYFLMDVKYTGAPYAITKDFAEYGCLLNEKNSVLKEYILRRRRIAGEALGKMPADIPAAEDIRGQIGDIDRVLEVYYG